MMKRVSSLFCAYALGVLACSVKPPLEQLWGPILRSARILRTGDTNAYAGRTSLASGTAFATISTRVVNSDSIINATFQVTTTTVSGLAFALGVSSIVDGVSFAYGCLDGVGRAPGGTIMWEVGRTK